MFFINYFALSRGAKYYSERVCMSVWLYVGMFSVRSRILKTTCPNFTKFSLHVTSDNSAILYVLPVLWTMSRLPIVGHIAHG